MVMEVKPLQSVDEKMDQLVLQIFFENPGIAGWTSKTGSVPKHNLVVLFNGSSLCGRSL